MKCEKVTIEVFMSCWFNQDYEILSKDDFDVVFAEYIDLAGLYQSKEFELVTYINYLKNRIFVLKTIVASQEMYFDVFKTPYMIGIELIKEQFGLVYEWDEDERTFRSFLRKLENNARSKSTELKRKEFELDKLKEEKDKGDVSKVQSRHEFIKMLNGFSKTGYKIDRDKTTVEELALMIKQVQEESAEYKAKQIK